MKILKRICIILLILSVIILGFVGNYFYNFALNPNIDKSKVVNQDKEIFEDQYLLDAKKWFNSNKKEININSVLYNKELTGYILKNNNNSEKFIFVIHGYTSNAENMSSYIKHFYEAGYNVFAPDLFAHGKSQGDFYTMGGYDSKDLVKWIDKISKENNNPEIVLFGISMGGATVMNSLDENLPNNVKIVIEDSGYVSLEEEFTYQLKKLFGLPKFPVILVSSIATKINANFFFSDVDATNALKENKLPFLILHGEDDGFVPMEQAKDVYDLLENTNKEIHYFKGAKHVKAEYMYREKYWDIILKFLKKNNF